jgi:hypothetical protein
MLILILLLSLRASVADLEESVQESVNAALKNLKPEDVEKISKEKPPKMSVDIHDAVLDDDPLLVQACAQVICMTAWTLRCTFEL